MTCLRVSRDYPHPPGKVWRVLTDPNLMALWSMRPESFAPVVGTRFKFYGKPNRGWRGFVECEVLEVREQELLRFSWVGNENSQPTEVCYTLEPRAGGTRLIMEHSGFRGVGGFLLLNLFMRPGWNKTFNVTFPAVLADVTEANTLRPESTLKPLF
ncbi:MAG: SRPBCC domain-containing protein [Pseudomonadota bacterium]